MCHKSSATYKYDPAAGLNLLALQLCSTILHSNIYCMHMRAMLCELVPGIGRGLFPAAMHVEGHRHASLVAMALHMLDGSETVRRDAAQLWYQDNQEKACKLTQHDILAQKYMKRLPNFQVVRRDVWC